MRQTTKRFTSAWLITHSCSTERVNGTIYYLVGVLICLTFYPRGTYSRMRGVPAASAKLMDDLALFADIAVLAVIILSICDTSASVFGRLFGRYTPPLPFSG